MRKTGTIRRKRNRTKTPATLTPTTRFDPDEILPEYDFSRSLPNKYALRALAGIVLKNRARPRVHP